MSEAEYSLCRNCCLTLGRLKAGSLFACPEHCRRKVRECLTAWTGDKVCGTGRFVRKAAVAGV